MATIELCCGKVCSGKSTYAARLQNECAYYYFSADEWMRHFFGEPDNRALFDRQLGLCAEMIYRIAGRILDHGENVVLDFGFWKKEERDRLRRRFQAVGHTVRFVYFPIDLDTQLRYMEKRQRPADVDHYRFDEATVRTLNSFFEEPWADEEMAAPLI